MNRLSAIIRLLIMLLLMGGSMTSVRCQMFFKACFTHSGHINVEAYNKVEGGTGDAGNIGDHQNGVEKGVADDG